MTDSEIQPKYCKPFLVVKKKLKLSFNNDDDSRSRLVHFKLHQVAPMQMGKNAQCRNGTVLKNLPCSARTDMEKFNLTRVMCAACRGKHKLYKKKHVHLIKMSGDCILPQEGCWSDCLKHSTTLHRRTIKTTNATTLSLKRLAKLFKSRLTGI